MGRIAVCPECGTPTAYRRAARSARFRRRCAALRVAAVLGVFGGAAAAGWLTRVESPWFNSWGWVATPDDRLPLDLPALRALAGSPQSGDGLVRRLLSEAEAEWCLGQVGTLAVGRAGNSGTIVTRWHIGWPFEVAGGMCQRAVSDLRDPDHTEVAFEHLVPDGPHINWTGAWGSTFAGQTYLTAWATWAPWLLAAITALLGWDAMRCLSAFRHRGAVKQATVDPSAVDPCFPPSRRRRRAFRVFCLLLAASMLVPHWSTIAAPDPWENAAPGEPTITAATLHDMLALPSPDSALAASIVSIADARDAAAAGNGDKASGKEHLWCRWMACSPYAYIAFASDEQAFVMPTLAVRWSQFMPAPPGTGGRPGTGAAVCPKLPLSICWDTHWGLLECRLPSREGDAARVSIVADLGKLAVWLGTLYLVWRVVTGAAPALLAWRSARRRQRGLCIACAYPLPEPR